MPLAMFDLDNTLIGGDSDYSWGEFLVIKKIVDPIYFRGKNNQFYRDYQNGKLDIYNYLEFSLAPFTKLSRPELNELHQEFMENIIQQMWLTKAEKLIESHKSKKDVLMVITSTNYFVVEPICKKLGIKNIIATELEEYNNSYTGKVSGIPSFGKGKVSRLINWLKTSNASLKGSTFYSDSINDLPLLQLVDNPVAVDPCPRLKEKAIDLDWKIISLRN